MYFSENLRFLRQLRREMTQENLAEQMGVSRQTVSKWESGAAYPELDKLIELCQYFNCSMDAMLCEAMNKLNDAYSNLRVETIAAFQYVRYTVISREPEHDAIRRIRSWADANKLRSPVVIGWDFPFLSQEQINVYHMHGYTAACVLPQDFCLPEKEDAEVLSQAEQKYAAITIKEPFVEPFSIIPNAYKALAAYMQVNGIVHKNDDEVISCFEREYEKDGVGYMDVCIAVE